MATTTVDVALTPSRKAALVHHPKKAARAANLHYVHDDQPGITRKRRGKGWTFMNNGRVIKAKDVVARINALAIPPAWSDVWICPDPDGHLQATGKDVKGRKQYRYHARWASVRGQVKFHRLHEFGQHLPNMRLQIAKDLNKSGMPKEKVLAGVVALMEQTHIRVGNRAYEHDNGSFGLSTLKDKHVKPDGKGIRLKFKGKSGVVHDIALHSVRLARLVKRCKELPGQDLFQYEDDDGAVHHIDSGMVNEYVRLASGGDFSSKDLRTWSGSAYCVEALLGSDTPATKSGCAECVNKAMDMVADHLGNTRAVCKAHYVHPGVVEAFEGAGLNALSKGMHDPKRRSDLSRAERVLMKICAP